MTDTSVCGKLRLDLGVYLVGALGAADRSAVGAHLACCAKCRDQLAELAGLPGLLRRVTADAANALVPRHDEGDSAGREPSADLSLQLLLRRAARRQRHRRWPRMAANSVRLIAGAAAASKRYATVPYWTRRAITGKRSGPSVR
jgi:predicted anti-sigma-YlaC factor YlaD